MAFEAPAALTCPSERNAVHFQALRDPAAAKTKCPWQKKQLAFWRWNISRPAPKFTYSRWYYQSIIFAKLKFY